MPATSYKYGILSNVRSTEYTSNYLNTEKGMSYITNGNSRLLITDIGIAIKGGKGRWVRGMP